MRVQPVLRNTHCADQPLLACAMSVPGHWRCGTTIGDGTYTLERVLGQGGMGTVFAGAHNWTGRSVAIKVLHREFTDELDVSRVLREARAATAVAHPHVVQVLDMGRDPDGVVYLVFERLHGETLAERLDRGAALSAIETAELLLPVLDALAVAHRLGIVHRDLKPENIFLEDDGRGRVRPKLLDFGLARMTHTAHRTQTTIMSGTPAYMSPERAFGKLESGPECDVWSMGVVLFECMTNRLPFDADHAMGTLLAVVSEPVPSLRNRPGIPRSVADVVDASLERDVTKRIPHAGALRDAFAAAIGTDIPQVRPDSSEGVAEAARIPREARTSDSVSQRPVPWDPSSDGLRWLKGGSAIVILLIMVGGLSLFFAHETARDLQISRVEPRAAAPPVALPALGLAAPTLSLPAPSTEPAPSTAPAHEARSTTAPRATRRPPSARRRGAATQPPVTRGTNGVLILD